MSTVYDCTRQDTRQAGLTAAANVVRSGRLVVFPTDTVYGIGCDAFDSEAVQSLLAAKGRGAGMPASVLVGSWETMQGLVLIVPPYAGDLVEAFWPGGLSLVLPHAPSLAWDLGDTRGTVMLRMPLHPVALELLREVGPMAQSSANRTGMPPATTAEEAEEQLGDSVPLYLDSGPSGAATPSTIMDLTGSYPRMLREGAVSAAEITAVLGIEIVSPSPPAPAAEPEPAAAEDGAATPEPLPAPEPAAQQLAEPASAPEPASVAEPQPVSEPQPVNEPEPVAEPRPVAESQPVNEPAPVAAAQPVSETQPVSEPEPAQADSPAPSGSQEPDTQQPDTQEPETQERDTQRRRRPRPPRGNAPRPSPYPRSN